MINDFLSHINSDIVNKLGIQNYRIEEDTELIDTEEEKYPATRNEGKYERISMDDDYDYVMYHRVTAEASTPDEELSFGTKITYRNTITSKMVVSTKIHIGKDFVRDVKEAFPHKIDPRVSPTLTKGIFVEVGGINFDHDANVLEEFGETGEYGKIKDNWFVSIIDYDIITFECR